MNQGRLHIKYANALYDFAEASNAVPAVYSDMNLISGILSTSAEFKTLMESPVVFPSKKKEILTKLFSGKCSDVSLRFLHFLVEKRREMHLNLILVSFFRIYREKSGITRIEFNSAIEVTESFKVDIQKDLKKMIGGKLELVFETKPELIGGFTLFLNDSLLDASVASKLRRLKTKVEESYNRR